MSCKKCGYQIDTKWCCTTCSGNRCENCDPSCKKEGCDMHVCPTCMNKSHFPGLCYKCNSKCWICERIPYPPCPQYIKYVEFGDIIAVICPRHTRILDKINSLAEGISQDENNLTEKEVRTALDLFIK